MAQKVESFTPTDIRAALDAVSNARFWYINGNMGMTASGSFTRDRGRWMQFTCEDMERVQGRRPYGATRNGIFVIARA